MYAQESLIFHQAALASPIEILFEAITPLEELRIKQHEEPRGKMGIRQTSEHDEDASAVSPRRQLDIAVVGGGLGGLSLAIGLVQRGISAQVYEGASSWTDAGAGLVFAKNSMDAMKKVSPDIYEAFAKRSSGEGWDSKKTAYMDW